ncbi:MAG: HD domain-containing protein [Ferruginibacter sp.]
MLPLQLIERDLLEMLQKGLDPKYSYHNLAHTTDVVRQSMLIAQEEGVMDEESHTALHLAALYHDSGFLHHWKNHEEQSCLLAKEHLPGYGITSAQLDEICKLIMATKLPHNPSGILQQIICDADLDYLGREDFFTISGNLYEEFMACGIVKSADEWEKIQNSFLHQHCYFTSSSNKRRNPLKQQHIQFLLKAR